MRRLLMEELAKAKGVPPSWAQGCKATTRVAGNLTMPHIWMAIGDTTHSRWCDQGCAQAPDAVLTTLLVSWMEAAEEVGEGEERDWIPRISAKAEAGIVSMSRPSRRQQLGSPMQLDCEEKGWKHSIDTERAMGQRGQSAFSFCAGSFRQSAGRSCKKGAP